MDALKAAERPGAQPRAAEVSDPSRAHGEPAGGDRAEGGRQATPLDELRRAWCRATDAERARFLAEVEDLPY